MRALLEATDRLADEYRRRLHEAREGTARSEELAQLERQISALQRGIGRLIDSSAAGVTDRSEFEPRVAGLKARVAQLQERQKAADEMGEAERELTLVIGQLEDFDATVRVGLDRLDWLGMREIIRTLVRRIEIDGDHVEVVFRVPPPVSSRPPPPGPADGNTSSRQDCTGGRGENISLAVAVAQARARPRAPS